MLSVLDQTDGLSSLNGQVFIRTICTMGYVIYEYISIQVRHYLAKYLHHEFDISNKGYLYKKLALEHGPFPPQE